MGRRRGENAGENERRKSLSNALRPGSTPVISGTLSDKDRPPGSGTHSLTGPLNRFTGWRSMGMNICQRECGADITSP